MRKRKLSPDYKPYKNRRYVCPNCKGAGHIKQSHGREIISCTCYLCLGTGKVTSAERRLGIYVKTTVEEVRGK